MPRKNVENKLCAVDYPALDDPLDIALLRRSEIVIEQQHIGIHGCSCAGDLLELASADQRGRIRTIPSLQDFSNDFCARALCQRSQFVERLFRVEFRNAGTSVCFHYAA